MVAWVVLSVEVQAGRGQEQVDLELVLVGAAR